LFPLSWDITVWPGRELLNPFVHSNNFLSIQSRKLELDQSLVFKFNIWATWNLFVPSRRYLATIAQTWAMTVCFWMKPEFRFWPLFNDEFLEEIRWLGSGKSVRDSVNLTDRWGMKEARLKMSYQWDSRLEESGKSPLLSRER
jgi:hypothetical protein